MVTLLTHTVPDKAQRLWLRKAAFQLHLWAGLMVGLYIFMIGATGSILVFRDELRHLSSTASSIVSTQQKAFICEDLYILADRIRAAYPTDTLLSVSLPTRSEPSCLALLRTKNGKSLYVGIQENTGQMSRVNEAEWVSWVANLHVHLLMGKTGLMLNGIGASVLILLCLSGGIIWWPGRKGWKRAFGVKFRANWRRINWDLHRTVGFWTIALLSLWAVSGVYFSWRTQVETIINCFSSLAATVPPKVVVPPRSNGPIPSLASMIQAAQSASYGSKPFRADFPRSANGALTIFMARGELGDFTRTDYIYFDPSTGRQLAIWRRGVNPTLGARIVAWLGPAHFGTQWGLAVKIVWAACGLALPLLFLTGALMYWNRTLSKKWKALGRPSPMHPETAITELPIHVRTDERLNQKIERSNPC